MTGAHASEIFNIPRVNVISSNQGYSVEVFGRAGIEYREGDRSAFIDSEVLVQGHGIAIFRNSIKAWRPPHDKEQMTEQHKQEIIENSRRAIGFRNEPIEIL